MTGGCREGVMVVVPALSERQQAEEGIIAAFIGPAKPAGAPDVADGIDAPCHVMQEECSNQAAPDDASQLPTQE